MLSSEQAPKSTSIWYLSEYLEPSQVARAFGLSTGALPSRQGTGAAQLNPHATAPVWRLFGVAALLAGWLAITRPSSATPEIFVVPGAPAAATATTPSPPATAPATAKWKQKLMQLTQLSDRR